VCGVQQHHHQLPLVACKKTKNKKNDNNEIPQQRATQTTVTAFTKDKKHKLPVVIFTKEM
jgi:late competence protein required for DNA uptake (superfamily II DNA/RNA helicase)